MDFVTILTMLYASVAFTTCVSYAPQFWILYKNKTPSMESISLLTWCLWTSSVIIVFLYASFVIGDLAFIIVSTGDMIWHILILTFVIKRKFNI